MAFPNQKGGENQKEEDQEQVKDLEGNGFKGVRARKVAQIASRYFTASGALVRTFEAIRSPNPPPPQKHFELRFRRKREEFQSEPSNFVQISKKTENHKKNIFFHDFRFSANPPQTRPDSFFCFELRFRRNRTKNANWKTTFFGKKPISVIFAYFPKSYRDAIRRPISAEIMQSKKAASRRRMASGNGFSETPIFVVFSVSQPKEEERKTDETPKRRNAVSQKSENPKNDSPLIS